jgi:hypothetical protein
MILGNFDLDYDDADLLLRKLEAFFPIVFWTKQCTPSVPKKLLNFF